MTKLVELDALEKVLTAVLYSGYVKNAKPLSLLIVAKPESAKTAVLKKYRKNRGLIYITDCTAYGLAHDVLGQIKAGDTKHILIPDLIVPLSKSVKTRMSLVAFLNSLIEEGIAKITSYVTSWDKEVSCGLVTAVTDEALKDGRHEWAKMGFLSRMILFSYSYPISTVYKIFKSLTTDETAGDETVALRFPRRPKNVMLPRHIAEQLQPISMTIGESMRLYGFRFFLNSKTFLKSLALMDRRTVVNKKDLDEFLKLSNYFNWRYNPV